MIEVANWFFVLLIIFAVIGASVVLALIAYSIRCLIDYVQDYFFKLNKSEEQNIYYRAKIMQLEQEIEKLKQDQEIEVEENDKN